MPDTNWLTKAFAALAALVSAIAGHPVFVRLQEVPAASTKLTAIDLSCHEAAGRQGR